MSDEFNNQGEAATGQPVNTGPGYYVSVDQNGIVQGWFQLPTAPTAENFHQITQQQYQNRYQWPGAKLNSDGTLVRYDPPVSFEDIQAQARAALQQVQSQAIMTSMMGETFGPQMRGYVDSLRGIVAGENKTVTALPAPPADPTK